MPDRQHPDRRTSLSARKCWRRGGLTLVETLLALVLCSSVLAVSGVVAVQTVSAQRTAQRTLERQWERERALDQFERDLLARITWLPEAAETLIIEEGSRKLLTVACLVPMPTTGGMTGRHLPARVTYLVEPGTERDRFRLVREHRYLHESRTQPAKRVLADGLTRVEVETYDGHEWREGNSGSQTASIQAVRLRCRWNSHEPAVTRTVRLRSAELQSGRHG